MTIIAGIVSTDGTIHMAADTACLMDNRIHPGRRKIARMRTEDGHEFLIATAGNGSLLPLVRAHLTVDAAPGPGEDLDPWAQAIAEAVCGVAVDSKPPTVGSEGYVDGAGVLGYGGRLWTLVQHDAQPAGDGFLALGAGSDIALGALAVLLDERRTRHPDLDHEYVDEAVRIACRYDAGCNIGADGPLIETLEARP